MNHHILALLAISFALQAVGYTLQGQYVFVPPFIILTIVFLALAYQEWKYRKKKGK